MRQKVHALAVLSLGVKIGVGLKHVEQRVLAAMASLIVLSSKIVRVLTIASLNVY